MFLIRGRLVIFLALIGIFNTVPATAQTADQPIGVIQGIADTSPYLNRFVNFRGVVIGRYEDENTRGDVYYTLFVQNLPADADADPATSDGIAVFLGREPRLDIPLGAVVRVGGKVTEFYGLTEIDDKGLVLTIEETSSPLPPSVPIDPPADMPTQAAYFEALEGMRVAFNDAVIVAGSTHEGCGFAVIKESAANELPVIRRANDDPAGRVVPALYPSDRACDDIPQVRTGDRIAGLAGALTYNFDQFKIIFDATDQLTIEPAGPPEVPILPEVGPEQITVASINAEDYFDTVRDTNVEGEPVPEPADLAAHQTKLANAIAHLLHCPTLVALQEVEHESLAVDLSAEVAGVCGFRYEVSHLETPDERGIDNALLSDPARVDVTSVELRRACSPVPTAINDPEAACAAGTEPLFGRPPLQVTATIDGKEYVIFVNHFKSKRGGEIESGLERVQQAVFLNGLVTELLAADPATRIIALGDLNDTELSPALALLSDPAQGGRLVNALATVPPALRYTYNFGGVSELIDAVLLSPSLAGEVGWASILHVNADYPADWRLDTSPGRLPFRTSDHDIPVVALGEAPPTPEPTQEVVTPTAPPASPLVTATASETPPTPPSTPQVPTAMADERPVMAATTPVANPAVPPPAGGRILLWGILAGGVVLGAVLVFRRRR